jgi:hypothetical protein
MQLHLAAMASKVALFLFVGLSAAADYIVCTLDSCYATEPNLPRPTTVQGPDGAIISLLPFVWSELSGLAATTTITTTITETDESGALITPTVPIVVQPKGYWYFNLVPLYLCLAY